MQLRKRAIELQKHLGELQRRLQANAAAFGFEALLAEFAIVNSQFSQLQAELHPQLQYYVAHPMHLTAANRDCVFPCSRLGLLTYRLLAVLCAKPACLHLQAWQETG